MKNDYRITEILKIMKDLDEKSKSAKMVKIPKEVFEEGARLSKTVCAQAREVVATPLMKNLLVSLGDVTQTLGDNGEYSTSKVEVGKKTKAVEWLNQVVEACLKRFNGPKVESYSLDIPLDSRKLYDADCWLGWKPEVWDIVPGMEEKLKEDFPTYSNPKTTFSMEQMVKAVVADKALQKAIIVQLSRLPEVRASDKVREVSDPFMSKKTGVSYPYFKNDSTIVPGKGITYGKLCVQEVEKAYSRAGIKGLIDLALNNNVYVGYTRRQRGKPRPLRAQSRLVNIIINMINGPEIEASKKTPQGVGFLAPEELKAIMIKMLEFTLKTPGYTLINKDFTSYDANLGYGWQVLQNSTRHMKANGSFSKKLVELRHICGTKSMFIDGLNHKSYPIYGRQMSGYDDTTLGNTCASAIACNTANMKIDPDYTSKVYYPTDGYNLLTLGDDVLTILRKDGVDEWVKTVNSYGFSLHEGDKDAVGAMFLQYRLYRNEKGEWVMGYNWPRVLRSMMSKEDKKQLGQAGWTLAFYQQIGKCIEIDDASYILVNICASLDKDHLMLDIPIEKIKQMVKEEDAKRFETGTPSSKRRALSTAERLDTNPHVNGVKDGQLDWDYFGSIQKKLKTLYDPDKFWNEISIPKPNLSVVK